MNHLEFLNARSSVRDFDPKNIIKKSVIEEMVRNAANAPSSNNFQPWKAVAVANKANRVQAYLDLHPEDAGIEGLKFDLGLFSMNLMHVVRTFGYESVPMRGVDFEKVKEYLHVPENYEAMLMLPVGKSIKAGYPHARYE